MKVSARVVSDYGSRKAWTRHNLFCSCFLQWQEVISTSLQKWCHFSHIFGPWRDYVATFVFLILITNGKSLGPRFWSFKMAGDSNSGKNFTTFSCRCSIWSLVISNRLVISFPETHRSNWCFTMNWPTTEIVQNRTPNVQNIELINDNSSWDSYGHAFVKDFNQKLSP